ncbi:MAG: helix-turn-helix transcriptional regulator [Flavobacteriaceae bacterium]|jgi:plasmid maintenance system antidote protein VapI|nr:helix-turn-helix transcriptional regulator [Flavobacteriaceae bacterium]MDG2386676.1 helix-turn-helix transcriptional regulator [Flavobacteriaceae bacterium]
MLNIEAFLKRLEQLMENHQLNAAAFAEKIGVQRSSVSHILSRRNKPSLDFILKIQAQFEEADFDWLLLGARQKASPTLDLFGADPDTMSDQAIQPEKENTTKSNVSESQTDHSDIIQIIQTYKDGSFRVFLPKS